MVARLCTHLCAWAKIERCAHLASIALAIDRIVGRVASLQTAIHTVGTRKTAVGDQYAARAAASRARAMGRFAGGIVYAVTRDGDPVLPPITCNDAGCAP